MRKSILIFLIIGLTSCFGQNQTFKSEADIVAFLNQRKVNLSEPISLKNGLLTTKNIMMGFDGKPVYENEVKIDLKDILEIKTEFYEKTNITALKFISKTENSIQEKQLDSNDFHKIKTSQLNLRFVKPETLADLLSFFKEYNSNNGIEKDTLKNEPFGTFIHNFCIEKEFQIERIKFPLKLSYRKDFENYNAPLFDTIISKKNWKHDDLYYDQVARFQIYDNFQKTLKDTDERVVHYQGIENGRDLAYFFKRINGLWFLIAIENKND